MVKHKILVVEDDNELVLGYKDNQAAEQYDVHFASSLEEANKYLSSETYEGIIIDLKLKSDSGTTLIKKILEDYRLPIVILSATANDAKTQFENQKFIYYINKSEGENAYPKSLKKIADIANTSITSFLSNKGELNKHLNKIYWEVIPTFIDSWIEKINQSNNNDNEMQNERNRFLRYVFSALQESLSLKGELFDKYHPEEYYFLPPTIKKSEKTTFTGNIYSIGYKKYIVLTPSCDLALRDANDPPKAKKIVVALIESLETLGEAQKKDVKKGKMNMYHYLPKIHQINMGDSYIDFASIESMDLTKVVKSELVASVTPPFRKDIIARFASYFSRQGQPEIIDKK